MSHTLLITRHIHKIKVFVKWSNQSFINAFIVNDTWIQIALRVTDADGPGKGDRSLLGVLLRH